MAATTGIAAEPGDSFQESLEKIKYEYSQLRNAAAQNVTAAESEAQREKAIAEYMQKLDREGGPLLDRALALVQPAATDPAAAEALAWIVESAPGSESAAKAADLLERHHLTNEATLNLASRFDSAPMSWTESLLTKLSKAPLPEKSRARALLSLAKCVQSKAKIPAIFAQLEKPMFELMKLRFGEQYVAKLQSGDADQLEKRAIAMFQEVAGKFGEVEYGDKTIADVAEAAIYEIENLSLSKAAPEIEGEDIDGVAFRLSDYRGKVVLLDFWGHW